MRLANLKVNRILSLSGDYFLSRYSDGFYLTFALDRFTMSGMLIASFIAGAGYMFCLIYAAAQVRTLRRRRAFVAVSVAVTVLAIALLYPRLAGSA